MTLSKSKIIKKNAVITEEAYTIPVTPEVPENPEPENPESFEDSENPEDILSEGGEREEGSPEDTGGDGDTDGGEESGDAPDAHADILTEREKEIDREAVMKEIVEQAQAQAQRTADLIVSYTLENAKDELNDAMKQGYSDGFEAGKNEAMSIIAPALGKIGLLADAVTQAQDKMLEDFRDEMFNIIAGISQKILRREIDEKDEYLLTLFEDALQNIKAESFVTVTVSEAQAEFALRNIDLFKAKVANIEDFKIIADENAERGTMIVETAKMVADASFTVQMNEIDAILARMKENLSVPVPVPVLELE